MTISTESYKGNNHSSCPYWTGDDCTRPRTNPRGEGAYYAKEMTKIGPSHEYILDAARFIGAYSEFSELTAKRLTAEAQDIAKARNATIPTLRGLGGRISELVSMGLLASTVSSVRLKDRETMTFRPKKRAVYWLNESKPRPEVKQPETLDRSLASFYGGV